MTELRTSAHGFDVEQGPPSVDVLIVSYNTRELLEECLTSILLHAPPPARVRLGIKVFENASNDDTVEMLERRFPTVELTRSPSNLGFARANNALAQASRAEYLLLLNPDTVWVEDIVEPLLEVLRSDPRPALAGPRLIFPDGRLQLSSQRASRRSPMSSRFPCAAPSSRGSARFGMRSGSSRRPARSTCGRARSSRETDFLWATCWLLARADVERYGLFDPGFPLYDEDLDFCTRLRRAGRTIVYRPDVELVHVGGASSTSTVKLELMRSARTHYYRVHRGRAVARSTGMGCRGSGERGFPARPGHRRWAEARSALDTHLLERAFHLAPRHPHVLLLCPSGRRHALAQKAPVSVTGGGHSEHDAAVDVGGLVELQHGQRLGEDSIGEGGAIRTDRYARGSEETHLVAKAEPAGLDRLEAVCVERP